MCSYTFMIHCTQHVYIFTVTFANIFYSMVNNSHLLAFGKDILIRSCTNENTWRTLVCFQKQRSKQKKPPVLPVPPGTLCIQAEQDKLRNLHLYCCFIPQEWTFQPGKQGTGHIRQKNPKRKKKPYTHTSQNNTPPQPSNTIPVLYH